ncbi:hypothetical protein OsJ_14512 [Oryza sativa Japonica Group]|uniref:Uncharacterized protein n=1 Tax=Oryza sativa subsp. japonica TaxID=39947 RepID=B9FET2_ORYSJ|nr:hypothetical protein OsJ_14512 [Oryza sativa Japonica Group]
MWKTRGFFAKQHPLPLAARSPSPAPSSPLSPRAERRRSRSRRRLPIAQPRLPGTVPIAGRLRLRLPLAPPPPPPPSPSPSPSPRCVSGRLRLRLPPRVIAVAVDLPIAQPPPPSAVPIAGHLLLRRRRRLAVSVSPLASSPSPSPSEAVSATATATAVPVAARLRCVLRRHRQRPQLCPPLPSKKRRWSQSRRRWLRDGEAEAVQIQWNFWLLAARHFSLRSSSSFIPMYFVLSIASAGKKNMRLLESWKLCGGSTQMLIEMVLDLGAVVLNCRESDHEFVVTINIFLALMMEKELMSEIKVMDMVWNCKFFGTPLLFMDIMVIDDCSRFRIGCLPGNLILTCFSQGAFVDPRKHREVKFERTESYGAYEHQTLVS